MARTLHSVLPAAAITLVLGTLLACGGGDNPAPNTAPAISSFAPASGFVGQSVVLTGSNFAGATAVKFNGASATYSVDSATQITAAVPAGATTGTLSVTTPQGTGTSAGSFTVSVAAPTVASLNPTSGKGGDTITVTGTGFASISGITLGGVGCVFGVDSATSLHFTVPFTATAGAATVAVTNPGGTGTSAGTLAVQPAVSGMNPPQGPVGTPVVFAGSGFSGGTSVTFFNGALATSVTVQSPTQLTAIVPAGAATGAVSITANGVTAGAGTYTVGALGTTQDLSLDGLYLVQSVQDYAGTVPLVANREAYLRVFVKANQASVPPPVVRVTITSGGVPWTQDIAAPAGLTQAPTAIDESLWGSSWNLLVPGAKLQTGATVLAQVNPAGAVPEADGTNNAYPSSGSPASLNVQSVKTFKTTLVPITQQGLTGNATTGRTAASWADRLQRMYPIQAVDVQVRSSALVTSANLNTATGSNSDGSGWSTALSELEVKRAAEASDRYYFGCVNVNYTGGTAGLGYVPSSGSSTYRSALGWDKYVSYAQDGYNYPEVFAHEVGHNFGRNHAPCGVSDPDPNWPTDAAHATADIGVYGYDVVNSALKLPTAKDIMSYCDGNLWLSDYTYKGVLAYRAAGPIGDIQSLDGASSAVAAQPCLIVSGSVRNGAVELNPGFQVDTVPSVERGGSHELRIEDASGNLLHRVAFEPAVVADLPEGQDLRHFILVVPLDSAAQAAFHRLRVVRSGVVMAERETSLAPGAMRVVRDPVARVMKPGQTHLSWDHAVHPKVMVRDPRTGEVIAFLEGGSAMVETDARELEFTFSDGVRSERRVIRALD
jgi:hypothetical protein